MDKPHDNRAWLFVAPVLLVVAFSAVVPLITVVNYSVQDILGPEQKTFVGREWFQQVLRDPELHGAFLRQLVFSLAVLAIELPLGLSVALCIPRSGVGSSLSLILLALPLLIPWNVVGTIWQIFCRGDIDIDMNHGISFEGVLAEKERMGLGFALQYFVVDGTTNYSLPGRDTLSIPGARRRNQLVGRVEPFMKIGDVVTAKLGLSAEYFQADLPKPTGKQDVARAAIDGTLMVGGLTVWAEYTQQFGRHVLAFPFPDIPATNGAPAVAGRSSDRVRYYLLGGEYTYDMLTLRYNYSVGDYVKVDAKETRSVPGVSVTLNQYLMALVEYNRVTLHVPGDKILVDSGLYLTLHGKF